MHDVKRPSVWNLIASLLLGTVALVALAQSPVVERPSFWPRLNNTPNPPVVTLSEWYSDVPWHQKLGSYAANEIMAPLVFPFEVLPADTIAYCNGLNMTQEDCMIEAGVVNVLGYHRFDTLYSTGDERIKKAAECAAPFQCTEVRLEISNFAATVTGKTGVSLQPLQIGYFVKQPVYNGFYITDGSTYAPQMLWEMSHYCDSMFTIGDMQDPVCYGDYFSPMNDGFHPLPGTAADTWPQSQPWSVFPAGDPPEPTNQCRPLDYRCIMVLAGFNMSRVPKDASALQYNYYNNLMMQWFNNALVAFPQELGQAEIQRKFPWSGVPVTWESFVYPLAMQNPFLGAYTPTAKPTAPAVSDPTCNTGLNNPVWHDPPVTAPINTCTDAPHYQAAGYVYPRNCSLDDLATAYGGDPTASDKLRACGLNYEIHPNGWLSQWPTTPVNYQSILDAAPFNYSSNQYGRTSFIFGGVRGMQMPVSFAKNGSPSGLSVYEQVHNASIFSLYLPAANIADVKRAMGSRNYGDTGFYHTLLMSNHMESDPEQFADGIRGKVLWHNEYRMEPMYEARNSYIWLKDRLFQASFDPLKSRYDSAKAPAPFHNNTCDGCHVRNGSGVPINTGYSLDPLLQEFMDKKAYVPYANGTVAQKDYTFTGVIRPMKLVFFDLQPGLARLTTSKYSSPLNASADAVANAPRTVGPNDVYYNNKVMNFYGDSFHATPPGAATVFNYTWYYENADAVRVVDGTTRTNKELGKTYLPQQIHLDTFTTPQTNCQIVLPSPTTKPWPESCADIGSDAILAATKGGVVGYMLLNGKRLGNLGVIESIPNTEIQGFRTAQVGTLGAAAGEIVYAPGARDGVTGTLKLDCVPSKPADCFIGRFGWLGNRASLEDQVANAAFVEMNMLTSEGYQKLYRNTKVADPIRYKYPNCGAANKLCVESTKGNSELTERDIDRMADYARWLGNPTRSEIQVSQPEVIAGEQVFKNLQCDTCHVIRRIDIDPEDTMLTKNFRTRMGTHISAKNKPYLSYIGTDLLMHDMGYLSQVGNATQSIRDSNGFVKPGYENFVQKVRTPPLKGLRFNNYVTDAHRNTTIPGKPGCDFLLHDGRACDAFEAALLHDGPAVKKLQMIDALSKLEPTQVMQLRAFLYSL